MKLKFVFFLILPVFILLPISNSVNAQNGWQNVDTENQSVERHENAFVKAGNKFYLIGGRGIKPVDIYDPESNSWSQGSPTPIEISHFQAVSLDGLIYVMGGLTGNWPSETPLSHIYIYDPVIDRWITGPEIPPHRQRGAAGVTVYDDKIYLVGGIVNGHTSGWVAWFDEFDPATNNWRELPDAPRSRDHFMTAVAGDKLVATGGRLSGYQGQGFESTIKETDIYNFKTGTWTTLSSPSGDIPTERAGTGAISVGDEVIIIGGESGSQTVAHNEVEALNPVTGEWRQLPPLQTGRHGTQPILYNGKLYIEAGSGNRGGGPELSLLEMFDLPGMDGEPSSSVEAGILELTATSHNFGSVRPHSAKSETFTLKNNGGNQGIVITYMIVTGSDEFELNFPFNLPYVLGPGEEVDFRVDYSPKTGETSEGYLHIKVADRGNRQPEIIELFGN
jgi:hypothetical protein